MSRAKRVEWIRKRVAQVTGKASRGRRYPAEVITAACTYLRERQKAGASRARVAEELGLSQETLRRWERRSASGESRPRERFRRVQVVPASPHEAVETVLHGPCGIRVEGLSIASMAELIRRLS